MKTSTINASGILKLLMLFLLLAASFNASSHEYVSMIKLDHVWEAYTSYDFHEYEVKYMKFDGTEDFDGKTYNRIVTFHKSFMVKTFGASPEKYDFKDYISEDNICEVEGYLREEDGKVYSLAVGEFHNDWFDGALYPSDSFDPSKYKPFEVLLYDFSAEVGESYKAFSNITRQGQFTDFIVDSKDSTIINGQERYLMKSSSAFYDLVEGIGPTSFGCLNYSEYDIPAAMWAYNYFNRLFDLSGNVLFQNSYYCHDFKLAENLFSSVNPIDKTENFTFKAGTICFGSENHYSTISIFDVNGKKLKSKSAVGEVSVDTNELRPGIYVAECRSDGSAAVRRKFIVR